MIKLNLLPPQEKENLKHERISRWIVFYGVSILGILIIFTALLGAILLYINIQLQAQNKEFSSLQTSLKGTDLKLQQDEIAVFNQELRTITRLQNGQEKYSYFLASLAGLIPAGVRLDTLSGDKNDQIILYGNAQTRNQVIALRDALAQSKLFSDVESPLSNLVKQTDINFYFKFKILPDALNK